MIQQYINHIIFIIDRSGSMAGIADETIKVFDSQIERLATRSKELSQETRVSVFLFNTSVECLVYEMDVLRLPKLRDYYSASGGTALIHACIKSIEDLRKTPEIYADHSFLAYCLTDAEENSGGNSSKLSEVIKKLPDNWTVAAMVPNAIAVHEAKKCGFPANNISVWSTTKSGVKEAGESMWKATESFMQARASGVRSTKNLFSLDTQALNTKAALSSLEILDSNDYQFLTVRKEGDIKSFVESWKLPFRQGANYYQLTKKEKIQGGKAICIREKKNGKVYTGDNARSLLGLPNYEVKVEAASHPKYDIFVQSSSVNRKLVPGTELLVMK